MNSISKLKIKLQVCFSVLAIMTICYCAASGNEYHFINLINIYLGFSLYCLLDLLLFFAGKEKLKKGWIEVDLVVPKKSEHIFLSMQKQAQKEYEMKGN